MWHRFPLLRKGIHALSWISSRVVCFGWGSMNLKIFLHYHMCLIKESETILKHGCLVSSLFLWCGGGGLTKWFFSFLLIKSSFKGWFVLFISTRGMFLSSYFFKWCKRFKLLHRFEEVLKIRTSFKCSASWLSSACNCLLIF